VATLRFSERARYDLIDIGNFIGRDNPTAAAQFISELEQRCLLLSARPLSGRVRDELVRGLRSVPDSRYVIFYRPIKDGVEIVRVVHGARDLRRALQGDR
jgi:toxin ParE1/3/4